MPPRSMFKGYLRLSLVTVPVRAVTANQTSGEIHLNQLHADCHTRIKYQKVCPTHGEVATDEIVSGFEYTKDQYVIIDQEEIAKFRKKSEKTVDIKGFIPADAIPPTYYSGRTYYLLPDGAAGQKPYQLLREAMVQGGVYALASAVLTGREQLVLVRPLDDLLAMMVVQYAGKVKKPAEFSDEVTGGKISKEEMALTKTLIEASTMKEFNIDDYQDEYVQNLQGLIEAKVAGEEIVAVADPEEPKVINLMEALKASVENAQAGGGALRARAGAENGSGAADRARKAAPGGSRTKAAKPAKASAKKVQTKMAPSAKGKAAAVARKRKSG